MKQFNIELSDHFQFLKQYQNDGCIFQYSEDEQYNGRTVKISGKDLVFFASCGYLGIETHPVLIKAAIDAVRNFGTQWSFSRAMVSSPLYRKLEDNLKNIFPGFPVVFTTVTLAHCSVLPLIISNADAIILDAYVHNSVRMASQLCKANGTFVIVSKHNNFEHVKYLIYRLKKDGYRNIWYCADGIYSIHGNKCNINDLYQLLDEEDNFYAYIDDAHGTGWCGTNGSGYILGNGKLHDKTIVVEGFAKSMAAIGACVIVPDKVLSEFITLSGQTMIFSGPIQPATLGALVASTDLHLSKNIINLQNELKDLIIYFRKTSDDLGLNFVTKDLTPIQLLRIGEMNKTRSVQKQLMKAGYFATSALYPSIAYGDEGIRITLTRHLKQQDIQGFLIKLKQILVSI